MRRCNGVIESMPSYAKHGKQVNLVHRRQHEKSVDMYQSDEIDSAQTDNFADSDQRDKAVELEQRKDQNVDFGDHKEKKAKEQATKILQTCVGHYRLTAEALPPPSKNKVKKEINEMDRLLSYLSQHHSSPKIHASKVSSTSIKTEMEQFQRKCEDIIESVPSNPKHGKQVKVDHRRQPKKSVDTYQSNEIDSAQTDKSADSDQGDKLLSWNKETKILTPGTKP
ncbi:uncharacterized protein [Rutidosis leptorrhynchoides]|uniref:uncharacterized protein isoform X2 n=1 Tax=Rutidosis leptorrhynchoides TaxID=125765 RepID=UPI003A9A4DC5